MPLVVRRTCTRALPVSSIRLVLIALGAFVAPTAESRATAKHILGDRCLMVHLNTSLEVCKPATTSGCMRPVKKVRDSGDFLPYEAPEDADLVIDTAELDLAASVDKVIELLRERSLI